MPENPKNKIESDFHRRRKAFVILKSGVLTAEDGFAGSHFDLLRQSGFDEEQARLLIAEMPRGYSLDGNVYVYQGADFSCLSDENRKKTEKYVSFFRKNQWLSSTGKIYDGMKSGEIGSVWAPIKEFKISF
ncbi:MAG: hypothetical protein J5787_06990 [Alphaproteobacteria bacterium]|nr:hypothetical protein [Alphaproteobacteria bacterium]MBO4644402.1 hypothetical protein [Alphaproteobacteria bacterium]